MRKTTWIFLLALLAFNAQAQYKSFNFGLKASPQICWMKPNMDGYSNNGVKLGFSWGFISDFNFSENHSISTGFDILYYGGKIKAPATAQGDTSIQQKSNYSLKYLQIPLTLKMRTNPINGIRYFGRIGLGTSFRINAKKTDSFALSIGHKDDITTSNFEKAAFVSESLIVGMGGEYELKGGPKLGLELAFNNGFTNVLTQSGQMASPNFVELAFSVIF